MKKEITNKDLFDLINKSNEKNEASFKGVEANFKEVGDSFKGIEASFKEIREDISLISKTTAGILNNMATKQDIMNLHFQVNSIEVDLKSFKKETREILA